MLDRSMIENLLPGGTTSEVAHYTRIGTLCHFIPSGQSGWASAWATPVQFLNDRMELKLGLETLRRVARQLQLSFDIQSIIVNLLTSAGRLEIDAFQMSFSGNPDELGQWRGYAANGMGCSIVTDAVAVHQAADVAGWVLYDLKEQQIFAENIISMLSHETDDDLIEQVLIAAASYMKHRGFQPVLQRTQISQIMKFQSVKSVSSVDLFCILAFEGVRRLRGVVQLRERGGSNEGVVSG